MAQTAYTFHNMSSLQSLVKASNAGCSTATRLLLKQQRSTWQWGEAPKSYSTYLNDGQVTITAKEFATAMQRTKKISFHTVEKPNNNVKNNMDKSERSKHLEEPQPPNSYTSTVFKLFNTARTHDTPIL